LREVAETIPEEPEMREEEKDATSIN